MKSKRQSIDDREEEGGEADTRERRARQKDRDEHDLVVEDVATHDGKLARTF